MSLRPPRQRQTRHGQLPPLQQPIHRNLHRPLPTRPNRRPHPLIHRSRRPPIRPCLRQRRR
ncbi:MAG: hypothetical protein DCC55_32645 [Chloroflexi bacterium]|nr:MAG: hypothetical protein DCC55_32645 [Chloroflexota bacterium]